MEKDIGNPPRSEAPEPESSEKKVVGIAKEPITTASNGLEAIQDILFGEQLRSSNEQINQLQRRSEETLSNLSNSIDQRLDELTNTMNQKFEMLSTQLADQKNTQQVADERLTGSIAACKSALTHTIDSTREELTGKLDHMANEMEAKKLDRGRLSEMFSHVAQELASDPTSLTSSKS